MPATPPHKFRVHTGAQFDDVRDVYAALVDDEWQYAVNVFVADAAGNWVNVWQRNALPGPVTALTVVDAPYAGGWASRASWPAVTEPEGDVDHLELQWSTNGGPWEPTVVLASSATTADSDVAAGGSTHRFRIRTTDTSGDSGPWTTSTTNTLPPDPVTAATATTAGTSVVVAWTRPPSTLTSIRVERRINGGSWGSLQSFAGSSNGAIVSVGYSRTVEYRIAGIDATGQSSPYAYTAAVSTYSPPVTFTDRIEGGLTGGGGGSGFHFGGFNIASTVAPAPANAFAGYDVEQSKNGGSYTAGTLSSVSETSAVWTLPGSSSYGDTWRIRVRKKNAAGSVAPWNYSATRSDDDDSTAPTQGAPSLAWTNSGGGGFNVTTPAAVDTQSGVKSVTLEVRYGGGSWQTVGTISTGAAVTFHACPTSARGGTVSYRTRPKDNAGNVGTSTATSIVAKPKGTFQVLAVQSDTHSPVTGWRNTGDVRAGQFSATYGNQVGVFAYGTNFLVTTAGYTPDSGSVFLQRDGAGGYSGPVYGIGVVSPTTGGPAPVGLGSAFLAANLTGSDAAAYAAIPANVLAQLATGQANAIGIVATDLAQSSYRTLRGLAQQAYQGLITVVFN